MDFLSDTSKRQWLSIARRVTVPPYVDKSFVFTKEASESLINGEFADDIHRQFPIADKANTWISAVYLNDNRDDYLRKYGNDMYTYVEDRLNKAAAAHGITRDVKNAQYQLSIKKDAPSHDDSNYGWIVKNAEGEVIARKYKIVNKQGVIKAAEYFDANRHKYPYKVRRKIANFILKKADQYYEDTAKLPDAIIKEAGLGLPNISLLKEELERRSLLCKNAKFKNILVEMYNTVDNTTGKDLGDNLYKLGEVIDGIDRATDLHKYYGKGILLPADILYDVPFEKVAEDFNNMVKLGSFVFDARKLAALPEETYEFLGEQFIDKIKTDGSINNVKLASAIKELSSVERMLLEDQLRLL